MDLGEANFGQLSPSEKDTLMGILNEYIDVFSVSPKAYQRAKECPCDWSSKIPTSGHTWRPFDTTARNSARCFSLRW